ncbi:outer membrane protein assembly factor [Ramlibacter sp. XY19]|uniref:BamA/TamA family outer membrane protein n=1 Tax=Ramlibacter paludis TaxID=2908000 RepID=UPI0023DCBB15|nr:outer membrane protein assembly factor [Ramlibacter paludis]
MAFPRPADRPLRAFLLALACAVPGSAFLPDPAIAAEATAEAGARPEKPSRIRGDDGWLDISGFLDEAYGFIPLVIPITEPAVGVGGVAALAFIDKPPGEAAAGFGRPNISVVGALGTDNGTRGAFAGDMRHWAGDRVKTLVGVIRASVNLDFYGAGRDPVLRDHPNSYNLDTTALVAQARYRVGSSQAWVGLGYAVAATKVRFNAPVDADVQPSREHESRVGGLLPIVSFDSRDNVFTPNAGTYLELSAGLFDKALGSDTNFQRVNLTGIQYWPVSRDLTVGVIASSVASAGDVPFYLRPYIALRGVPVMRYQGDMTAQAEAEVRWRFWQRFSLVAFAGAGGSRNEGARNRATQNVTAGGVGFRYEIARKYGLHLGIDAATGPAGPAYYVQFGSAWARP